MILVWNEMFPILSKNLRFKVNVKVIKNQKWLLNGIMSNFRIYFRNQHKKWPYKKFEVFFVLIKLWVIMSKFPKIPIFAHFLTKLITPDSVNIFSILNQIWIISPENFVDDDRFFFEKAFSFFKYGAISFVRKWAKIFIFGHLNP